MSKYKLEDLKVGAVFKNSCTTSTIIAVGKTDVFYSYQSPLGDKENSVQFHYFLNGSYGDLVKPTIKIAHVEYWSCHDLSVKRYCLKEVWNRGANVNNTLKFIREFEIEVGVDGFPVEGGV